MTLIAVDADGVALDYNGQFGQQWCAFFGGPKPAIHDPRAYHAARFWGLEPPDKDHAFWQHFDQHGWCSMQPMPGAVEACNRLAGAGHEIVCVTSMPVHRQSQRLENLQSLGFPIQRVIATGPAATKGENPKKAAIQVLAPDWFVDDELRKLKDLPGVNCVLVDPGHSDCPNAGQPRDFLAMTVESLADFADRFLALQPDTGLGPSSRTR